MGETETALRCTDAAPDVGPSMLRRLSNVELQLTLQDLFALSSRPSVADLPPDNDVEGFKTFADVQAMSAQHVRSYGDLARALADALLGDAARKSKVVGCDIAQAACLREFVARFGKLAFRRPLAADEVEAYAIRTEANALDTDDRLRYALEALLVSPHFLYRVEIGDVTSGLARLSPHELAAKLSFALWGRAPSLDLLEAAERGELDTSAGLRARAEVMLGDARAQYFFTRFFRQWLGYDTLRAPVTPPTDWSNDLLPAMQEEADALLLEHAFGDGDFHRALTSDQTVVTPALARFYGLPGDGRVSFPADHARAGSGVLGSAALMSMKTDGDIVAVRGNWLRRTFFCSTLHIRPTWPTSSATFWWVCPRCRSWRSATARLLARAATR